MFYHPDPALAEFMIRDRSESEAPVSVFDEPKVQAQDVIFALIAGISVAATILGLFLWLG
ncbi:hypothetical protein [Pararhodobacter sp.]|uniref:hypothetical protein n=1 Tax=Pararhodobacter sp. TaxID=2127056 RepID=UPI002FDCD12E